MHAIPSTSDRDCGEHEVEGLVVWEGVRELPKVLCCLDRLRLERSLPCSVAAASRMLLSFPSRTQHLASPTHPLYSRPPDSPSPPLGGAGLRCCSSSSSTLRGRGLLLSPHPGETLPPSSPLPLVPERGVTPAPLSRPSPRPPQRLHSQGQTGQLPVKRGMGHLECRKLCLLWSATL